MKTKAIMFRKNSITLIVQQHAGAVQVEKIKYYSMWDKYS